MIEDIKDLAAELHAQELGDLCSLHHRKIGIGKTRHDHIISTEISKVEDTASAYRECEHRISGARSESRIAGCCRKPLRGVSKNIDRPKHIRTQRGVAGKAIDVGKNGDRVSGLKLSDSGNLPTFDELTSVERQLIDRVDHKAMTRIEVR